MPIVMPILQKENVDLPELASTLAGLVTELIADGLRSDPRIFVLGAQPPFLPYTATSF